ncbi:MAG TPA: hypothetical protein DDX06_03310 [Curvibacter sp.]|nr:hypothetical protein [Curvibacter sp.]|tara:strand:- start:801 stop:1121 length:321 start_codon:yes stop_codon:yes gene_type:complete
MIAIVVLSAIWGAANGWVERGIRGWLLGAFGANVFLGVLIAVLWQVALVFAPLLLLWATSPGYLSRVEIIVGVVVAVICYRFVRFIGERRHERLIRRIGLIGEKDL